MVADVHLLQRHQPGHGIAGHRLPLLRQHGRDGRLQRQRDDRVLPVLRRGRRGGRVLWHHAAGLPRPGPLSIGALVLGQHTATLTVNLPLTHPSCFAHTGLGGAQTSDTIDWGFQYTVTADASNSTIAGPSPLHTQRNNMCSLSMPPVRSGEDDLISFRPCHIYM